MLHLKQSTTITFNMGPFVDRTDGVTEETGLTLDVELSKNGGTFANRNSATAITHDANGWYKVELNTTDTDTLGRLIVKAHDAANALPVWVEVMVMPANVWDSLYGADKLDVNVEEWNATSVPAEHTAGYPICTVKDGTGTGEIDTNAGAIVSVTTAANVTTVNGLAANVITAASIATGAVDADALAADAVAEIADGVWDEPIAGHSTSGTYGEHHYLIYSGQCSGATTTTTLIDSGLTQADTDHWKGRVIIFLDGGLKFQATDITAFDPATDKLTFTAVTSAPTAGPGGTRYIIV